jgi:putative phosphoribosyl transferase
MARRLPEPALNSGWGDTPVATLFKDRVRAGRELVSRLERYRGPETLVLGLPRGGVVVAAEVARLLDAQFDVIVARKIGAPGNPEYGIGAVAEGGEVVLNEREISISGIGRDYLDEEIRRQEEEIARRVAEYRGGRALPAMSGRPVVVVDDGVATGFTMLAALRAVRRLGARPVVMAAPVVPPATLDRLSFECDDAVVVDAPAVFYAVGLFYEEFDQVSDEEVVRTLKASRFRRAA